MRAKVAETPTQPGAASEQLPPETITALLESAARTRRSGNILGARALLRTLSVQAPNDGRIWLALALVAETRVEQRQALEKVLVVDPQNPLARRGLAHMAAVSVPPVSDTASTVAGYASIPPTEPDVTIAGEGSRAAPTLTPIVPTPEERARTIRWPVYAVVVASVFLVLLATIFIRPDLFFGSRQLVAPAPTVFGPAFDSTTAGQPLATIPLQTLAPAEFATTPALAVTSVGQPSLAASATAGTHPSPALAATSASQSSPVLATTVGAQQGPALGTTATAALPSPIPSPVPTEPTLALGEVVQQGQWHAVLIRPEDAVVLDGSIGTNQPRGRFLLVLLTIGNDGAAPATIPADLFAVIDSTGTRYLPQPTMSTAYLDTFGRGVRGDLSMEDAIPAGGINRSVPLIFDVPADARNLSLVVKGEDKGWPIAR